MTKQVQVFDGDGKPQDFLDHLMADVEWAINNPRYTFKAKDREWMQQVARRFYAKLLGLKLPLTHDLTMSGEFVKELVKHHEVLISKGSVAEAIEAGEIAMTPQTRKIVDDLMSPPENAWTDKSNNDSPWK